MNGIQEQLERLEHQFKSLIEGSAARLFNTKQMDNDLVEQLARYMKESMLRDPGGESIPPNLFTVHLHPSQAQCLKTNPALLDELVDHLQQAGEDTGLVFLTPPVIRILEDDSINPGELHVSAQHSQDELSDTMDYPVEANNAEQTDIPTNAFLIVDGTRIFQLDDSIVNIGRRSDNHLVIDDPRISRQHAQLRVINSRYVIFDLESTGGTWINGKRVQKGVLQPGDVISLSGMPLIYGQDSLEQGHTQKYSLTSTQGRCRDQSNQQDQRKPGSVK